ncbi:hypothetical protein B7486_73245, partial [cyanobacterium TDX16]
MRRTVVLLALLVVGAAVLGACSDDESADGDGGTDDSLALGDAPCPFDAEELSEAVELTVVSADAPEGSPEQLICVFTEEGASIEELTTFTVASVQQEGSVELADLAANAAEQEGYQALPELGDDAFVVTSVTPVGDGTNLNEAIVTYEVDGTVMT